MTDLDDDELTQAEIDEIEAEIDARLSFKREQWISRITNNRWEQERLWLAIQLRNIRREKPPEELPTSPELVIYED